MSGETRRRKDLTGFCQDFEEYHFCTTGTQELPNETDISKFLKWYQIEVASQHSNGEF